MISALRKIREQRSGDVQAENFPTTMNQSTSVHIPEQNAANQRTFPMANSSCDSNIVYKYFNDPPPKYESCIPTENIIPILHSGADHEKVTNK